MSYEEAVSAFLKVKPEPKKPKKEAEDQMTNVRELFGNCEAEKCKRPERGISKENDKVVIEKKIYHRGCQPTNAERRARNKSSV